MGWSMAMEMGWRMGCPMAMNWANTNPRWKRAYRAWELDSGTRGAPIRSRGSELPRPYLRGRRDRLDGQLPA